MTPRKKICPNDEHITQSLEIAALKHVMMTPAMWAERVASYAEEREHRYRRELTDFTDFFHYSLMVAKFVRDMIGGDLVFVTIDGHGRHYMNLLESGHDDLSGLRFAGNRLDDLFEQSEPLVFPDEGISSVSRMVRNCSARPIPAPCGQTPMTVTR